MVSIAQSEPPRARWHVVLRFGALAVQILAITYLGLSISRYAAPSTQGFSEAPAWFFALLAAALCSLAFDSPRGKVLFVHIGVLAGIAILFRTNQALALMSLPFALSALQQGRSWRSSFGWFGAPVVASVALLVGHALLNVDAWRGVAEYARVNTALSETGSPVDLALRLAPLLVPSGAEQHLLIIAIGAGVAWVFVVALRDPIGQRRRRLGQVIAAIGAIAALAFGGQIPLLTAPYYPRIIMLSYYVLASFLVAVSLTWYSAATTASRAP